MKKINLWLILSISCFSILYLINNWSDLTLSQVLILLSVIPILFLIQIIRRTSNLKISDGMELIYILFVISAQLIGSIFQGYELLKYYDKIIHFLSGFLSSLFALTILNNTKLKNRTVITDIVFITTFTLAIAGLWEIFEFSSDALLNGDAQRVAISGVTDTMLDIISAFIASIIFNIIYYLKKPVNY